MVRRRRPDHAFLTSDFVGAASLVRGIHARHAALLTSRGCKHGGARSLVQAENDMVSGLATLRTAQAQLELATLNEKRQHLLYVRHAVPQRHWQQSLVDRAAAKGGLITAEIAMTAVRNRLSILGLNHAAILHIETARNLDRESADTVIRALIAGTITQRQISVGQNIVSSVASQGTSTAVFTIGDLGRGWMVAIAPETDASRLHVGDAARVTVTACCA